jgi:Phage Mu protein F like protein
LAKAGRDVAKQLETALGKLAKADDDDSSDKQADNIVSGLDLTTFGALDGSEWMLSDVAQDRAQDELLSLGISAQSDFFDHANTRAADYAAGRSAELVKNIDESTRDMLRTKIAAGLEAGSMREDIIDDIMESDVFSEKRATLIADTEVAMANGQGALAGYKEAKAAGVKLKKIWVCDSDPCPICEENQDIGEIEVESEFPSGDDCEVAHVNCLCHTESVVEDEDDDSD